MGIDFNFSLLRGVRFVGKLTFALHPYLAIRGEDYPYRVTCATGGAPSRTVGPRHFQFWSWPFPFQHGDLLSEGEDFEGGIASTANEGSDGDKEKRMIWSPNPSF
jgi:hypothetical protein